MNPLRRFLVLVGLRWLPVGLMIPVSTLLALDRGLTLAEFGSAIALQGLVVLLLELPTGGLSDAVGRRPVLLAAGAIELVVLGLLTFADTVAVYAVAFALQGVYRALDSGPLEAWYVDHALALDPAADIETGLSRSSAVLSAAIAVGAVGSGGLVALFHDLDVAVYCAFVLQLLSLVMTALLMEERRAGRRGRAALIASLRDVPPAVGGALSLLRRSKIIAALIAVELFWGFGMVTFETLTPVRLAEVLGDPERASALMGPVSSAGWAASAAGAALIPILVRRIGPAWSGFALRVLQGLTVVGMALLAGPVGVIAGFLATYAVHGAANPVHMGLLHRQVDGPYRASVVSLNSMVSQPAGSLGAIVLTAIASAQGTTAALLTGAAVLAAAAPLYLVARFAHQSVGGISTPSAPTPL